MLAEPIIARTDGSAHNLGGDKYAKAASAFYFPEIQKGWGYYLGDGISSNMAEYEAIIGCMKTALHCEYKDLKIISDSELCVRQINKVYAVRHPNIVPLFDIVETLKEKFDSFSIEHEKRENNSIADKLAEIAVKSGTTVKRPSLWEVQEMINILSSQEATRIMI